jgi:hypothetical protein
MPPEETSRRALDSNSGVRVPGGQSECPIPGTDGRAVALFSTRASTPGRACAASAILCRRPRAPSPLGGEDALATIANTGGFVEHCSPARCAGALRRGVSAPQRASHARCGSTGSRSGACRRATSGSFRGTWRAPRSRRIAKADVSFHRSDGVNGDSREFSKSAVAERASVETTKLRQCRFRVGERPTRDVGPECKSCGPVAAYSSG